MANNLYFYVYKDLNCILENIKFLDNISIKHYENRIVIDTRTMFKDINNSTNNNTINLSFRLNYIRFCLYKDVNVLIIMSDKYKYIREFVLDNKLKKINLLNNYLFNNIFQQQLSDNLMKLGIDTYSVKSFVDNIEMTGNDLYNSDIFYNLNDYILDRETKIRNYSFQPRKYPFIVHINSTNKMEIRGKNIDEIVLLEFIDEFIKYIDIVGGIYE